MNTAGIGRGLLFRRWLKSEPLVLRWIPKSWKWMPRLLISVAIPALWFVPWMSDAMDVAMDHGKEIFNSSRLEWAMILIFASGSIFTGGLTQWLNRGMPAWSGLLAGVCGCGLFSFHSGFVPMQINFWLLITLMGTLTALAASYTVYRICTPKDSGHLRPSAVGQLLAFLASLIFYHWAT